MHKSREPILFTMADMPDTNGSVLERLQKRIFLYELDKVYHLGILHQFLNYIVCSVK